MRIKQPVRIALIWLLSAAVLPITAQAAALLTIPALFARDHAWFDDRTLVISVPGGLLRYDVETGQSLGALTFGVDPWFMDLSPDGSRLVVADWNRFDSESQFHIVTVASGAVQTVRFARSSPWEGGTYSPVWLDNQTLRITAEGNGPMPVRAYDLATQTLSSPRSSNHGSMLASTPDRSVIIELIRNQSPGRVDYLEGDTVVASSGINLPDVFAIAVSPDAQWFVLPFNGSSPALVYRRVGDSFQLRARLGDIDSSSRKVRSLLYLPTHPYAISTDSHEGSENDTPGVSLRNAASLRVVALLDNFAFGPGVFPDRQGRISVSPNQQRIAVTTLDEVRVYDISDFLFHDDFDALD